MACNCASGTCNCVVQGGEGVVVSGTGAPGNPYIINAAGSTVTVEDTDTVDLTKTGNVITGAVRIDPIVNQNLITSGPDGLAVTCETVQDCVGQGMIDGLEYLDDTNQFRVKVSGDAGNTLSIGTDDGVFAPSSPVALGCGLEFGAFGEIQADVTDFASLTREGCTDSFDDNTQVPFAGPDTVGAAVYCDSDGVLRTLPEKRADTNLTQQQDIFNPGITVFPFTAPELVANITNPSDQYCMCGVLTFAFIPAFSGAAGTVVNMNHEVDPGTGVFAPITGVVIDNRGKTANSSGNTNRPLLVLNMCLDPGETKAVRHRVAFSRGSGDNGGAVLVTAVAHEIRWMGVSL